MSQLLGQNEKGQIHIYCLPQISKTIVTIKTGAKLVEEGLCRRCPGGTGRSRWLFVIIIDQSSWIIRSYDHIVAFWDDHLGSLWFGHIVDQDMINAGMMTIFTDLGFLGQAGRTWEWYWSRRQRNQPQAFKVRSLHDDHDDLEDCNGDDHDYILMIGQVWSGKADSVQGPKLSNHGWYNICMFRLILIQYFFNFGLIHSFDVCSIPLLLLLSVFPRLQWFLGFKWWSMFRQKSS